MAQVFFWLLLGILVALLGGVFLHSRRNARYLPVRRLEEVISLLRAINNTEFESLLDPHHEGRCRNIMPPYRFRQQMRARLYLISEYLQRLQHNADVLLRWAYDERFRIPATGREEDNLRAYWTQEIIEAALDVMRYCAFIRAKLWLWRKLRIDRWPMLPIPGSFDLRSSEFIDGPSAYRRLVEITGLLSLLHGGERCYEQLMVAVYGHVRG